VMAREHSAVVIAEVGMSLPHNAERLWEPVESLRSFIFCVAI
jgi:hypothetical protein